MHSTRKSILMVSLVLALTLGVAGCVMAHGGGHGWGGGGGWNCGWNDRYDHGGNYDRRGNIAYDAHGGAHERASNNAALHEAEMKNPQHSDVDYLAPHRRSNNCEGMTGPHGRHITE